MIKPIAFFDLDNTLADYDTAIRRDYEIYKSPSDPAYSVRNIEHDHIRKLVNLIRSQPNWWLNLEPLSVGFEILEVLEITHNIHIATKGTKKCHTAWTEKLLWSQKHIPSAYVTVTYDKSLLMGDILVDDYPPYLDAWLSNNPDGVGIMPINQYNSHFCHERVIHYTNKETLITELNRFNKI